MRTIHLPFAAALVLGCGPRAVPEPPPASAPAPRVEMETPRVCVIQDGELRMIPVRLTESAGRVDTLTEDGQPLSTVTPASAYAAGADWYQRNEPILFRGLYHIKYGLPRPYSPTDLVRVGEYRGVGIYADPAGNAWRGLVFIPDRPGCSFQAYEPPHRGE